MSFKLTNRQLKDPAFNQALAKLGAFGFKNAKTAYNVAKVIRKVTQEGAIVQELYTKLIKQYAELDEQGLIKPLPDKPGTFQIKEGSVEEWQKAMDDLLALEFEVPCHKINIDDLDSVGLTATDMAALDVMLYSVEAVPPAADTTEPCQPAT